MKTVLVPVDFSAVSMNAAKYATDMAIVIQANVLLVNVVQLPVTLSEVPMPADILGGMIADAEANMVELRNDLVLHSNNIVRISTKVVTGYVLDIIDEIAGQLDLFAIVMGCNGSGNEGLAIFGSTAISAMHDLSYPVMLIPGGATFKRISKVGLSCDMKDVNKVIPFDRIGYLVDLFKCSLDVLYVSGNNEDVHGEILPETISLQNALMKVHPKFHFIIAKDVEAGVAEFVKKEGIELLMVIPKKHGFLGAIFHKSVSKEIALNMNMPIMILH